MNTSLIKFSILLWPSLSIISPRGSLSHTTTNRNFWLVASVLLLSICLQLYRGRHLPKSIAFFRSSSWSFNLVRTASFDVNLGLALFNFPPFFFLLSDLVFISFPISQFFLYSLCLCVSKPAASLYLYFFLSFLVVCVPFRGRKFKYYFLICWVTPFLFTFARRFFARVINPIAEFYSSVPGLSVHVTPMLLPVKPLRPRRDNITSHPPQALELT